jgi:O-antigen/teichoic acid export membrane protein
MDKLRRVVNNTIISLFGQLITWSSTLLLTSAYGRFLGDVKFGELYFAITFVSLVGFPVELAFNQQLTRDVAEHPEQAEGYLWNTLLLKTLLWVAVFGIILVLVWLLNYSIEQRTLVVICGIDLFAGSVASTFGSLHYAFERALYPTIAKILEKGLSAAIGILLLRMGMSVQVMAFVILGGSVTNALWQAAWFFRLVGLHLMVRKEIFLKLLKGSLPFLAYGALGVIYYRIDTVMLSLMASTAAIGWYGAGYRLFDTLVFLPNIIVDSVMYPVFSKLSATSESALKIAVEKCLNVLLICVLPVAALFALAAPSIVGFLYHDAAFVHTVAVIQMLAPGLVFLYINTLLTTLIVTLKSERRMPIMAALALVFNLGLNFLLIPLYQQVGAALMTTLTELLLLIISLFFLPTSLFSAGSLKVGVKAAGATLVMCLVVFPIRDFSILVIVPIAVLSYIGATVLLKTIPRDEMQMLLQAIRKRRREVPAESLLEEDIYGRITESLPIIQAQHISEMRTQILQAVKFPVEARATLILPVHRANRPRPTLPPPPPRRFRQPISADLPPIDEEVTLRLRVVKARKATTPNEEEG